MDPWSESPWHGLPIATRGRAAKTVAYYRLAGPLDVCRVIRPDDGGETARPRRWDDPSWGMSGQGTRLMLGLIEEQGKIDWDEEGPVVPASTDPDEDPFPSAQQRWQAENESRLRAMEPDRVRLTGVKFSSNDHWLVLPSEPGRWQMLFALLLVTRRAQSWRQITLK